MKTVNIYAVNIMHTFYGHNSVLIEKGRKLRTLIVFQTLQVQQLFLCKHKKRFEVILDLPFSHLPFRLKNKCHHTSVTNPVANFK